MGGRRQFTKSIEKRLEWGMIHYSSITLGWKEGCSQQKWIHKCRSRSIFVAKLAKNIFTYSLFCFFLKCKTNSLICGHKPAQVVLVAAKNKNSTQLMNEELKNLVMFRQKKIPCHVDKFFFPSPQNTHSMNCNQSQYKLFHQSTIDQPLC